MLTPFGERIARLGSDPAAPPALVMPGLELSYAELRSRVERAAAWLAAEGCRPAEVIGLTIADELTHLTVSLALLHLGVPQVSLPAHEPPAVRQRLAQRLAVPRVVANDPGSALAGMALSMATREALAHTRDAWPCEASNVDADATAIYFTSSGTTGEPKIIPLSQRVLALRAERRNLEPGERMLLLTSVEDYPAKVARLSCAFRGMTSVLRAGTDTPPLSVRDLCSRHGVTRIDLGVLQAGGLLQEGTAPLPASVKLFVGGSRVPMHLRAAFHRRGGATLYVEYGTREGSGITSTFPVDRDPRRETVGSPIPEAELEIVDAAGRQVARGKAGEIRLRSARTIDAYQGDPEATARYFRDGWFHPGDIGSLTRNGSLCLHGRTDDMMNMNGIKIFPIEIERVLDDDPAVKAAAAFGLPSPVHGEIPVAAVELHRPGDRDVNALMARTRELLGVRGPRRIFVVDALPRNATGKVVTRDLIALASAKTGWMGR